MKLFKSKKYSCVDCGEESCKVNGYCVSCARYKAYQEYIQPSSVLPDELSPYKSLLTRYADLVEENKELKAFVKELYSSKN
jgi:predicted ATP-dependent serine protease